ncbi:DUF3768 domain-containing protein [uncultured Sphingomonas sp.]|uniref:DUF3768 domain-containing protein n=1 Tax=uncultured Sphingomonas sp. TaxID=158754 RepID=UPI0025D94434|nr:DUF3768 domain-containing protein [uncultured Sphingomonas sp.]
MFANVDSCAQSTEAQAPQNVIATLNDAFRRSGDGGKLVVTAGVIGLGRHAFPAIFDQVRHFDAFDAGNDPYYEHDFGALDWRGTPVFWKIDYYDKDMTGGSPDPADPAVTTRVLTIMLASEY